MEIVITSRHISIPQDLRDHIERRLHFALARLWPRVAHVKVRVGDRNGPRGGIDKWCTVDVALEGCTPVHIEEESADLYAAVSRAADRVSVATRRRLQRRSDRLSRAVA